MLNQHKVTRFLINVFALILLFSVIWYFIYPAYTSLLATTTDALTPNLKAGSEDSIILLYTGAQMAPMKTLENIILARHAGTGSRAGHVDSNVVFPHSYSRKNPHNAPVFIPYALRFGLPTHF